MNSSDESPYGKWQIPSFLGLDTALFALFWSQCYVTLLDIPVVTEEPFLFLAVSVFLTYMLTRLVLAILRSPFECSSFYVNQMGLIAVMVLGVLMALLWITLYYVSLHFLRFTLLPAIFLLISCTPIIRGSRMLSYLLRSMALSLACTMPAFYFMVTASPLGALFYPPVYYLALLIFSFLLVKESWTCQRADLRARYSLISTVVLLFVLIACLTAAHSGAFYERGLYYSFILGCAAVEILSRLRHYVNLAALHAISWFCFALSALLSLLLFRGFV